MDISNEKLAEIIADTKNIPQLNDAISELSRDTAVLRVNMENLTKEHEKHLEFADKMNELMWEFKQHMYSQANTDNIQKQEIADLRRKIEKLEENSKKPVEEKKSEWTLKSILQTIPSIITIISFIGFLAYSVITGKLNGTL